MSAALAVLLSHQMSVAAPIPDLAQIMADPQWVSRSPHMGGWSDDGRTVWYRQERLDSELWDWWTVPAKGGDAARAEPGTREGRLHPGGTWSPDGRLRVTVSEGDVWVSDRRGRARALTATERPERQPLFLTSGRVAWRLDDAWFSARPDATRPRSLVRVVQADDPSDEGPDGFLEAQQQRLFTTLASQRARESDQRAQDRDLAAADPTRPVTVYVGSGRDVTLTSLAPTGEWLLVAHQKDGARAKQDPMPRFVTDSGYVETHDIRAKVGTKPHEDTTVWLVSLPEGNVVPVDLSALPGRSEDPLAALRDEPLKEAPNRPVAIEGHAWSSMGSRLALQVWSADQKDRWTVVVDTTSLPRGEDAQAAKPEVAEHLHDTAWVTWRFNDLGWLDDTTLWFQSEQTGWSHLYTWCDGQTRALTEGEWEVHTPASTRDGRWLYFRGNRSTPVRYEVYRVPTMGGPVEQLTDLGGMNDYWLSPDEQQLLVKHSAVMAPPELYVQPAKAGATARRLTFTVGPDWAAVDWVEPTIEPIPSSHHDRPIWTKVYRPQGPAPEGGRPAVVFVHGAGYLQNSHEGWSYYFREAMFHSLLVERGYVVIDMDYRASAGYGRDWRTAIHRQMGHPELEDLADGVAWMVEHADVNPDRVGIYGGSYGGFLSLMALFRQPEVWGAGAALRPVTDWSNYNDGYTSAILHTPETDPEAFDRSSPIEHAEGLADPLLICHGMVDANVPYQDSVRLAQRLIELRKTDWELASYPMEGHGFRSPEAWYDEYRRILELFEGSIGAE